MNMFLKDTSNLGFVDSRRCRVGHVAVSSGGERVRADRKTHLLVLSASVRSSARLDVSCSDRVMAGTEGVYRLLAHPVDWPEQQSGKCYYYGQRIRVNKRTLTRQTLDGRNTVSSQTESRPNLSLRLDCYSLLWEKVHEQKVITAMESVFWLIAGIEEGCAIGLL